mmetsp:Transcript_32697/g.75035  ORF Transcript_32697/g.75035 Transcript_32697/m.75035 type:complete len:282 (-) Transcript_32697:1660-2505(-)
MTKDIRSHGVLQSFSLLWQLRQCGEHTLQLLTVVLKFALCLFKYLSRCLVCEARCSNATVEFLNRRFELRLLLAEARALLLRVDQLRQRKVRLHRLIHHQPHHAHLGLCVRGARPLQQRGRDTRERRDRLRLRLQHARHALGRDHRRRDQLARLDAVLAARVAHGAHERLQRLEVAHGALVGGEQRVVALRPAGHHERRPIVRQPLPQLLGDEGHERVEQTEARVEHVDERAPGLCLRRRVVRADALLGDLDVPVGVLVPQEGVDRLPRGAKVIVVELRCD